MPHDPMTAASRYTEEELRAIRAHKRRAIEAARDAVRRAGVKPHPKIAAARAQKEQKDG